MAGAWVRIVIRSAERVFFPLPTGQDMTLSRETFRSLIRQLEREHGPEQGTWPVCRFSFTVHFDDGAEYRIRWPRGVANPVWEVVRER